MTARKPTALKLLHGETRPSRLNLDEPQPRDGVPDPPDWLSAETRAVWDRTSAELAAMGLLTTADRDALAVYCQAVVHHAAAVREVEGRGLLVKGRGGVMVKNPACQMVREQAVLIKIMGQQFGLTPTARASLTTGPSSDPRDDLLSGHGDPHKDTSRLFTH